MDSPRCLCVACTLDFDGWTSAYIVRAYISFLACLLFFFLKQKTVTLTLAIKLLSAAVFVSSFLMNDKNSNLWSIEIIVSLDLITSARLKLTHYWTYTVNGVFTGHWSLVVLNPLFPWAHHPTQSHPSANLQHCVNVWCCRCMPVTCGHVVCFSSVFNVLYPISPLSFSSIPLVPWHYLKIHLVAVIYLLMHTVTLKMYLYASALMIDRVNAIS